MGLGKTIHLGEQSFQADHEIASPLAIVPDGVAYADAEGTIVVDRLGEQPLIVGERAPLGPSSNPYTGVLAWFENDPSEPSSSSPIHSATCDEISCLPSLPRTLSHRRCRSFGSAAAPMSRLLSIS